MVAATARSDLWGREARARSGLMRVFVVGIEGQIAQALRDAGGQSHDIVLHCTSRPEADLLRPSSIAEAIADFRPDIVINPAAYTAVDKAESNAELAFAINCDGARAVAAA